jgi:hypothetical protein
MKGMFGVGGFGLTTLEVSARVLNRPTSVRKCPSTSHVEHRTSDSSC